MSLRSPFSIHILQTLNLGTNRVGRTIQTARVGSDGVEVDRTALDSAHIGDIKGALGTVGQHQPPPEHSLFKRLLVLLAIMGPGLIVMVGDNDAGGVATYAQAGQNYGTTLLWTLVLLVPILIVAQEMVVRLGTVTGVGHGRLIKERFGTLWAAFSIVDLLVLNFLTIVTEFIGVSMALSYFGLHPVISVPLAALALIAMTLSGSFRRWERFMYIFIITSLLVFPIVFLVHPLTGPILRGIFIPSILGGVTPTSILFIIAIVGTTVAPWQLFFQQSNVVDKRITTRWINYERADTFMGAILTNVAAAAIMIGVAFAFGRTHFFGNFVSAGAVAISLGHHLGYVVGALFAIVLFDASVLGASAVTLSVSYAVGDVFGAKHSLHRSFRDAKAFYLSFSIFVLLAAGIVLIPHAPLGLITLGVQALAGVLLPSAIVFLLLLCNDRAVLGPWVNPAWLNIIAGIIVTVLVILSLVLMVATMFPNLNLVLVVEVLVVLAVIGLGVTGVFARKGKANSDKTLKSNRRVKEERKSWSMPPLALLERPQWSATSKIGMYLLRGYLVVAVVLLVIKVVEIGIGHP